MIGKKFIEEHNIGQKVKHAVNVGAKVVTIGATAYALHQKHKNDEGYKQVLDAIKGVANHYKASKQDDSALLGLQPLRNYNNNNNNASNVSKQEYAHYGDVWAPGHKLNTGWSK